MKKLLILLVPIFIGCCPSHEERKEANRIYHTSYWDIVQINDTTLLCIPYTNKQEPKTIIIKDGFKITR